MNVKPKVSLILPVYNAAKYVGQTLDVLSSQTYKNIEIIVINDGSTDDTGSICEACAGQDKRVRYIVQENAGVGATRNRGIMLASSDYIMFMDADDDIDSDYVEKMVEALVECDADLAVGDIDNIDTGTGRHALSLIRLPYGVTIVKEDRNVISKVRTFCWGKIYKKSLWINNGIRFPEGDLYRTLPGFEDVCCLPLLAACADRIVHVKEACYHYYRGHENSLMHEAKFSYFLNSQKETMRRFEQADLEAEYHVALRKFMLGQLTSANRWSITEREKVELWNFIKQFFPEIAEIQNYQIYAPQGLAYDVLKCVFFDRSKFTDQECSAVSKILKFEIQGYCEREYLDYETFCYETADKLIDRLPEIIGRASKEGKE